MMGPTEAASTIVPRFKVRTASGKTVYVYGAQHPILLSAESFENAGHYDRARNDCAFTEPVRLEEGQHHFDKQKAAKAVKP